MDYELMLVRIAIGIMIFVMIAIVLHVLHRLNKVVEPNRYRDDFEYEYTINDYLEEKKLEEAELVDIEENEGEE